MRIVATLFLISTFSMFEMIPVALTQDSERARINQDLVTHVIDLLWSPYDGVRSDAKRMILDMGPAAKQGLISILEDIYSNPDKPRYAKGKENEARHALEHYKDYPPDYLYDLEITGRLKDDIAELLGQLRAVEAVPILIKLMKSEISIEMPRGLSRLMRGLAKIGSPAIPMLVDEVKAIPNMEYLLPLQIKSAPKESSDKPGIDQEAIESIRYRDAVIARIKAIIVLGEIGDEQVLPVLEMALEQPSKFDSWKPDIPYIEQAIMKIKEKNK